MGALPQLAPVAEIPGGLRLRGLLAWLAWLLLHLPLVGFRKGVAC